MAGGVRDSFAASTGGGIAGVGLRSSQPPTVVHRDAAKLLAKAGISCAKGLCGVAAGGTVVLLGGHVAGAPARRGVGFVGPAGKLMGCARVTADALFGDGWTDEEVTPPDPSRI